MIDFNVNNYVYVQLTDAGRKEIERANAELRAAFPNIEPAKPLRETTDGWSRWQLHSLMNYFGHMMTCGCESPFEMNIKIDVEV